MTLFLTITTCIIFILAGFILSVVFIYRNKQMHFIEKLKTVENDYNLSLTQSQLEIQEQTFQHISREIHDNINLSLTLAKLHLNTFNWNETENSSQKLDCSIKLLSTAIAQLSDISKSLNADIIIQQGLLKALEEETERIKQTGIFDITTEITGTPVYMDSNRELIIFRIIQEAFNNIIKHAKASRVTLKLEYEGEQFVVMLTDNGKGFDPDHRDKKGRAGLTNMENRIRILNGEMQVFSSPDNGSSLIFTIPTT